MLFRSVIKGEPCQGFNGVIKDRFRVIRILATKEDVRRAEFGIFIVSKSYIEEYRGSEISKRLGIL